MELEQDATIISDNEEYSGAPKTPRGDDGLIEGDRQPDMPKPDEELFVVMPLHKPAPKESVLRPVPGFNWTVFYRRSVAREIAEKQTRENPDTPFGIYGPYESEEQVKSRPWDHPRSTPCDTYEMMNVTVRRVYNKKGELTKEIKQLVCNHVDFGYVAPSKNVIEDMNALKIPGSALTNYLDADGNLISPNVQLLAKNPEHHMKDEEYNKMYKQVIAGQHSAVDALIDDQFRRALPKLYDQNVDFDYTAGFSIWSEDSNLLFTGAQPVPANKLPLAYAQILRTALTSWYGKVYRITMEHPPSSTYMEFVIESE